jgi:hypothetical protein
MFVSIETDDNAILEYAFQDQLKSKVPVTMKFSRTDNLYKMEISASSADVGSNDLLRT